MTERPLSLAGNPHLAALSDEEAQTLLARATRFAFEQGEILMREGEPGESMILLDEGKADIQRGGRAIASLEPGATIGEMALLDPAPRSATVVAGSAGAAFEVSREAMWELLADGDPVAIKVLQGLTATVCGRLGDVNRLVQEEVVRPRGNVFSRLWKSVAAAARKETK